MDLHSLPEIATLAILLVLLRALIRRHPESRVALWFTGLLLILGEEIAHFLFTIPGPWHTASHVAALDCYLAAATVFTFSSLRSPRNDRRLAYNLTLNAVPRLAALTLYGLDVRTPAPFYVCAAFGLLASFLSGSVLLGRPRFSALQLGIWGVFLAAVHAGAYRFSSYWLLFYIFAFASYSFWRSLPRSSLGRYAIVAGLGTWSFCFLTHSLALEHPVALSAAQHLWDLQKFLVAFGMLMVMLEDQVSRNRDLALHDELTGLPNRRLFDDRLSQVLLQGNRTGARTGLFLIDLNDFKQVNDRLGHKAGDLLLQGVATNLAASLRSSDTLARLGGDEFAIIVGNLRSGEPLLSALHAAIRVPISLGAETLSITASIGLAIAPDDGVEPDLLFTLADSRMYLQKGQGASLDAETSSLHATR